MRWRPLFRNRLVLLPPRQKKLQCGLQHLPSSGRLTGDGRDAAIASLRVLLRHLDGEMRPSIRTVRRCRMSEGETAGDCGTPAPRGFAGTAAAPNAARSCKGSASTGARAATPAVCKPSNGSASTGAPATRLGAAQRRPRPPILLSHRYQRDHMASADSAGGATSGRPGCTAATRLGAAQRRPRPPILPKSRYQHDHMGAANSAGSTTASATGGNDSHGGTEAATDGSTDDECSTDGEHRRHRPLDGGQHRQHDATGERADEGAATDDRRYPSAGATDERADERATDAPDLCQPHPGGEVNTRKVAFYSSPAATAAGFAVAGATIGAKKLGGAPRG